MRGSNKYQYTRTHTPHIQMQKKGKGSEANAREDRSGVSKAPHPTLLTSTSPPPHICTESLLHSLLLLAAQGVGGGVRQVHGHKSVSASAVAKGVVHLPWAGVAAGGASRQCHGLRNGVEVLRHPVDAGPVREDFLLLLGLPALLGRSLRRRARLLLGVRVGRRGPVVFLPGLLGGLLQSPLPSFVVRLQPIRKGIWVLEEGQLGVGLFGPRDVGLKRAQRLLGVLILLQKLALTAVLELLLALLIELLEVLPSQFTGLIGDLRAEGAPHLLRGGALHDFLLALQLVLLHTAQEFWHKGLGGSEFLGLLLRGLLGLRAGRHDPPEFVHNFFLLGSPLSAQGLVFLVHPLQDELPLDLGLCLSSALGHRQGRRGQHSLVQ
eukprot:RCo044358